MHCCTGGTGAWKEQVKCAYESDEMAAAMEGSLHPGGLKLTERTIEAAKPVKGARILELACGRGTTTHFLTTNYDCLVYGIDLSVKSLLSARGTCPGGDREFFIAADVEKLPFTDRCFDMILCECSFSLLPDKQSSAREIFRVLKPGGKFVMTDMVIQGDPAAMAELRQSMPAPSMFSSCLADALTIEDYINVLHQCGMKNTLVEDHSSELRQLTFKLFTDPRTSDLFKGHRKPGEGGFLNAVKKLKPGYYLLVFTKEDN